jgi:GNAT superfamily N-acetyltransferase
VGSALQLREARAADAGAIGRLVADSFEGYREFAPDGWEPPGAEAEAKLLEPLLERPDFWCAVAEYDGAVVAHSAFLPAAGSLAPSDEAGLAHLRALFVDREWWGRGVAARLHSMAVEEAARRGFRAMRLFTPALQARARRFYEREGWAVAGEPFESELGLTLVEYRRDLP